MPNTKFLCIDDQQDRSIDDLLKLLCKSNASLSIDRTTPIELAKQIKYISDTSKTEANFGLLLDLRLDMEATADHPKVPYRGPTLAQELRTRMTEKKLKPFPIVLWSITEKFVKSFDETSHDLFDAVYGKDDQITDQPRMVAEQMVALSIGYELIAEAKKSRKFKPSLLGLPESAITSIHATFVSDFKDVFERRPVHEIALRLLNDLIRPSGLLATEEMVAARLGVDIKTSGADWEKLKKSFDAAKYKGPFGDGWPRWWWFGVEDWWNALKTEQPNLRRIGAVERVTLLNEKLKIALKPAQAIDQTYSDKFFTICIATNKPIDPTDGLRVTSSEVKLWQDPAYVSIYAALNRIAKEKWRINPLDRDRFDRLKK